MTHCLGRISNHQRNLLMGMCLQGDCFVRGKCSPRLLDAHDTLSIGFWSIFYWSLQYCLPIKDEKLNVISVQQGGMISSGDIDIRKMLNGLCKSKENVITSINLFLDELYGHNISPAMKCFSYGQIILCGHPQARLSLQFEVNHPFY